MQTSLQTIQDALQTEDAPSASTKTNSDDVQSIVSELTTTEKDSMNKIIRLLNSSMKVARTFRTDIRSINRVQADGHVHATIDGGADTCLLGSSFRMFEYSERRANVASFDDAMHVNDLRIGSGVTAYDNADGSTVLLMIYERIDYFTR